MPLYRVRRPLSLGNSKIIDAKVISPLTNIRSAMIDILLARRHIALVKTPPLTEIPEVEKWVEQLAKVDIVTLEDFLLTETAVLARRIKQGRDNTDKLKVQLTKRWLQVERLHDG